jgi:hypothetical protein
MERTQDIGKDGVVTYRRASILKDRSRLIDGKSFDFWPQDVKPGERWDYGPVWKCFEPVYKYLAAGNAVEQRKIPEPTPLGPLFARGNAEAFWQRRRQVDALLEEIDGVYSQWIPGSGGLEKQLRTIIFNLQFNTRSKNALAERSPEELKRGLDVIEYLSRYVAKNYEHLEKMYEKGEYENITVFLSEEKLRLDKPGAIVTPDDDKIPEFDLDPTGAPQNLATVLEKSIEKVKKGKHGKRKENGDLSVV